MTLPTSGALTLANIQTEFGGTNPIGMNEYYAGGAYVPAGATGTYGAVPSSGALQVKNFYGTSAYTPIYIEDVFSTYLYTGNGSTQTITNGIDLAGKGGMTWFKRRDGAANHQVYDTNRGGSSAIFPDLTLAAQAYAQIDSFNANGLTINNSGAINSSGTTFASWTFRKQPKFFDVVTYTGNGGTLSVSHSLGSQPACIIIKRTDSTGDWLVCTRKSAGNMIAMYLNTNASNIYDGTEGSLWSSTTVSINWINSNVASGFNTSGATYVMYVLAHNAGGFGLTGSDNVISCGSYTGTGANGNNITLGYEPQWLLVKRTNAIDPWMIFDNMRGMSNTSGKVLYPYSSQGEDSISAGWVVPTSTGFRLDNTQSSLNGSASTYIYIAIRRGLMKTPTDATKVFKPVGYSGNSSLQYTSSGFPVDLSITKGRTYATDPFWFDRMRGPDYFLRTIDTASESSRTFMVMDFPQDGLKLGSDSFYSGVNLSGGDYIGWYFRRAAGFFDEVCANVTSAVRTYSHNLTVAPELLICKRRGGVEDWITFRPNTTGYLALNSAAALSTGLSATSTATTFTLPSGAVDYASTYVFYLFASCAGVSKVGSYTGNGSLIDINCGFAAGARFVLIKRTDSTGDWYVWDSTRGITASVEPFLTLNTSNADDTSANAIDPYSAGFRVKDGYASAPINTSGATYIYLAIA